MACLYLAGIGITQIIHIVFITLLLVCIFIFIIYNQNQELGKKYIVLLIVILGAVGYAIKKLIELYNKIFEYLVSAITLIFMDLFGEKLFQDISPNNRKIVSYIISIFVSIAMGYLLFIMLNLVICILLSFIGSYLTVYAISTLFFGFPNIFQIMIDIDYRLSFDLLSKDVNINTGIEDYSKKLVREQRFVIFGIIAITGLSVAYHKVFKKFLTKSSGSLLGN